MSDFPIPQLEREVTVTLTERPVDALRRLVDQMFPEDCDSCVPVMRCTDIDCEGCPLRFEYRIKIGEFDSAMCLPSFLKRVKYLNEVKCEVPE